MTDADGRDRGGVVGRTDGATRRRLVRAVLSSRPGLGTPEGASGPHWPALVVGVLLAAAMAGAVGLTQALTTQASPVLAEGDLVIGRTSGARYLDLGGRLHPVLNTSSARLLTRAAPRTVVVDDEVLGSRPHGAVMGIPGAPDDLPARDRLLPDGWVACPDGDGVRLSLRSGATPDPTTPTAATVVVGPEPSAARYLLVAGRRLAVPPASAAALGTALTSASAVTVAPALLDLFSPGSPLDAASLALGPGVGSPLPDGMRRPGVERAGQLVDTGGVGAVVLPDGLAPLDPFAAAVYAATAPGDLGRAVPLVAAELGSIPLSRHTDPAPSDWPRQLPLASTGVPCARLVVDGQGVATTTLLLRPVPDVSGGAGRGAPATAVDVPPGAGSLVRVGSSGSAGPVLLVDGTGTGFPVAEPTEDTLSRLGYDGFAVPRVPVAWAALLPRGPVLSAAAARAGPR